MSMFLAGKNDSAGYERPPVGEHLARCVGIAFLGTQTVRFDGELKSIRKVALLFELPGALRDDRGRSVPQIATLIAADSLAPRSNMRKALESWRGKPFTKHEERIFDYATLVGVPVRFSITHRESAGRTYVNLDHFRAAGPDGPPPQFHGDILYTSDDHDPEMFSRLPPHIRQMIERSPEFQRRSTGTRPDTGPVAEDGDVPF